MPSTQEMSVVLSIVNSPSSEIKWREEDDHQDHILKRFSLIWCTNHRAAQDKREPVEDNAHGEELVAEVGQEWEEDIEVTESQLIMARIVSQEDQGKDVTQERFTKSFKSWKFFIVGNDLWKTINSLGG